MADDSMWDRVKSAFDDVDTTKPKTPVRELDKDKVAAFTRGFNGDSSSSNDDPISRRLNALKTSSNY